MSTIGLGAVAVALGVVLTGVLAAVAVAVDQPLIFPSLGPTVYVLLYKPNARTSAPRNVVIGHGVAILAGVVALAVFGLYDAPLLVRGPVPWSKAGAAALSVGSRSALRRCSGSRIRPPPRRP